MRRTLTLTRWQHFSAWNDAMTAILKLCRHIHNPTPSIDAKLKWLVKNIFLSNFIPIRLKMTEGWHTLKKLVPKNVHRCTWQKLLCCLLIGRLCLKVFGTKNLHGSWRNRAELRSIRCMFLEEVSCMFRERISHLLGFVKRSPQH